MRSLTNTVFRAFVEVEKRGVKKVPSGLRPLPRDMAAICFLLLLLFYATLLYSAHLQNHLSFKEKANVTTWALFPSRVSRRRESWHAMADFRGRVIAGKHWM